MLNVLQLSPRAFWDVNMDSLDEQKQANWLIVRVFERGTLDDLMEVWAFYGDEKVKKALLTAPYLTEQTWKFTATIFKLNPADFKCSTTKQFHLIAGASSVN